MHKSYGYWSIKKFKHRLHILKNSPLKYNSLLSSSTTQDSYHQTSTVDFHSDHLYERTQLYMYNCVFMCMCICEYTNTHKHVFISSNKVILLLDFPYSIIGTNPPYSTFPCSTFLLDFVLISERIIKGKATFVHSRSRGPPDQNQLILIH